MTDTLIVKTIVNDETRTEFTLETSDGNRVELTARSASFLVAKHNVHLKMETSFPGTGYKRIIHASGPVERET